MPNTGDNFITKLKQAHLEWGTHRYTNTRGIVIGEGYLQIPATVAYAFQITNNNLNNEAAVYTVSTSDGFIVNGELLASGNQSRPKYAKQFHGHGALKLLGDWFHHIDAQVGEEIEVRWLSPTSIILTKIE